MINKLFKQFVSRQFLKFLIVGFSAFFVDVAGLNLLLILGLDDFLLKNTSLSKDAAIVSCSVVSTTIAITYNFTLQKLWAFESRERTNTKEFSKFIIIQVFNLVVFSTLLFGLLISLNFNPTVAKVCTTVIQMGTSFFLYKYFVFFKKNN